jgi:hypothetical protein
VALFIKELFWMYHCTTAAQRWSEIALIWFWFRDRPAFAAQVMEGDALAVACVTVTVGEMKKSRDLLAVPSSRVATVS